jgi:hypothetical protein
MLLLFFIGLFKLLFIKENLAISQNMDIEYLKLSYATYCPPPDLVAWNCTYCQSGQQIVDVIENIETDNLAITTIDRETLRINLVFRGSHSIKNFIQDIQFLKSDMELDGLDGVYIASGFYKAYMALADRIAISLDNILANNPGIDQIYISGHSLGGAISSIAAIDLKQRLGYNVVGSYTFGSPRVGNVDFSELYQKLVGNTKRFTNNADIVPHLPPILFGFRHVLRESWLNGTVIIECSPDNSEDPSCANNVSVLNYNVADHLNYFGIEENCISQYVEWKQRQNI